MLDRSHRLAATMMVASAFMGTLESVFLRLLGPTASQGQVLLFRSGLLAQYETARAAWQLDDAGLADLARCSVRGSTAPADVRARLLAGIDAWLTGPAPGAAARVIQVR